MTPVEIVARAYARFAWGNEAAWETFAVPAISAITALTAAEARAAEAERAGYEKGVRDMRIAVNGAIDEQLALARKSCGVYARPYRDMQKAVKKIALLATGEKEKGKDG